MFSQNYYSIFHIGGGNSEQSERHRGNLRFPLEVIWAISPPVSLSGGRNNLTSKFFDRNIYTEAMLSIRPMEESIIAEVHSQIVEAKSI